MRIIGGQAKGIRLKSLKDNNTRPTSDRVKESIFNILAVKIHDATVLDLFSGTGNLGLESVSRGASRAYLIEHNKMASKIIQENIDKTKFNNSVELITNDVFKAIKHLRTIGEEFDIIFMDPPYCKGFIIPTIESIFLNKLLKANGTIVVEHDTKDNIPDNIEDFKKFRQKKYGNTMVSFFDKED